MPPRSVAGQTARVECSSLSSCAVACARASRAQTPGDANRISDRSCKRKRSDHMRGIFLTAERSLKECIMFGRQYLLTRQLMTATALALGVSGIALADDSSMNPFTGESFAYFNGGQNRGNPNMLAQNPHPQGAVAAGTRQKKDEQTIESKTRLGNRQPPIISPSTYAG